MTDWRKGDIAELIFRDYFKCDHGIRWLPTSLSKRRYQTVADVKPCRSHAGNVCGCVGLVLSDGSFGHEARFRKVTPPKTTVEDMGIIEIMRGKKVPA